MYHELRPGEHWTRHQNQNLDDLAGWSTLVCPGLSWSVWSTLVYLVCPGLSWTFLLCPGLSWSVMVCPGLSWCALSWPGLSWFVTRSFTLFCSSCYSYYASMPDDSSRAPLTGELSAAVFDIPGLEELCVRVMNE